MWPILTDRVAWSVCLSVTLVSPAKTAAPIELPFGLRTWVGPGNHVLDGLGSWNTPFTRYNRLSNRLYNRIDNRLYRVYGAEVGDHG